MTSINKTPLYANHIAINAKMVDFHGWDMPLHYGSQIEEHNAVRKNVGMFDVSHMTIVDILGPGTRLFLRKILANDIDKLKRPGQALYTVMCNEHGGIIDDLIVYQRSFDNFRLILNSATKNQDINWLHQKAEGFSAGIQVRLDLAMIAIQGPNAIKTLIHTLNPAQVDAISTVTKFESVEIGKYFFARTGYTGEDGFEIIAPPEKIKELWEKLIHLGVKPCGLAARDTLRLEAGMLLYGQDMDENTSPLESGLSWTVAFEPLDRNFIGQGALISQKQFGVKRKLIGLSLDDKIIMRKDLRVFNNDIPVGVITSGTYSPTLEKSIAFARINAETYENLSVEIRGKLYNARVQKIKFYP